MNPIGYRPPHSGAAKVQSLRSQLEAEQDVVFAKLAENEIRNREIITTEIPAIRCWNLSNDLTTLTAISFRNYAYEGPVARTQTSKRGTDGFWTVMPRHLDIIEGYVPPVAGLVRLSGTVVEHTMGYRGEVMTIDLLYVITDHLDEARKARYIARHLEERYQCDVEITRSWKHFCAEVRK